jgi:hypothetical protein
MQEPQVIEVRIDQQGGVTIQVRNVKGPACTDLTRDLEAALGGAVQERQYTLEYDEQEQEQEYA